LAGTAINPVRTFSVLLADGHEAYRDGLARAVAAHPKLELAAEAADGRRALELLLELEPDVGILEVRMPQLDGLEVCDILAGLDRPLRTRLVLISGEANETLAAAASEMGLEAVLSKDSARHQLCDRIVEICERSV
jgi:two-component system, NarL family, nitrate/nitrite response regulator NarL